MCSAEITYHVQLKAAETDICGYTNYVFENLDYESVDFKYIMTVRFPNWNQSVFNIGDIGYVNVKYVTGGVDKWFDGTDFNTYKYTNVIFMKFIPEKSNVELESVAIN